MATKHPLSIRLEFTSNIDMVDFVEVVGGHVSRGIGLDEDSVHWVGISIRECVVNAIKHGNKHDTSKRVVVEFETAFGTAPEMTIRIRDEGAGFDLEEVADPLAPENLLKGSGRGIFMIQNFMDEVLVRRIPEGGMEIHMVKRAVPAAAPGGSAAS